MGQHPSGLGEPSAAGVSSLADLPTEAGGEPAADYELRSTLELVESMNAADTTVPAAVAAAAGRIAALVDAVSERLLAGGRLVYVGAGSSGRIAAVDAAECEPTFSTRPGEIVAVVAGGATAPSLEQEAAEDDRAAGVADLTALRVGPRDAVVGISASGRTPYVLAAVEVAVRVGALTACVVSVDGSPLGKLVEHEVSVVVGPEFLAGSTRLKAGTAQKLVLNMLTTISMIRLGKTFGNLMVDVQATNEKLRARVRSIVCAATGASAAEADAALAAADGNAKVAVVSVLAGIGAEEARARLEHSGQRIRQAVAG